MFEAADELRSVPFKFLKLCHQIINNVPQLLSYFSYADICIGVHGAGLGNCFFANDYAIMLEFGNWHNFGFDGFARIAHMTGGAYIFHDIRKEATLVRVFALGLKCFNVHINVLRRINMAIQWELYLMQTRSRRLSTQL